MEIRAAESADLPAILGIYNDAVLNLTATYDCELQSLGARAAWYAEHQREGYPVFVAEDEPGRVLGWSSLSKFRPRPGYRFTGEDSIYVAADWRGKGVGRLLLLPVIGAARKMGLRAIMAGIDAESQASRRLHARFGFEQVAYLKEVGFKFGRWLDVVYMELLLG
jgi:L-amino acid N-acyltransferase YncA